MVLTASTAAQRGSGQGKKALSLGVLHLNWNTPGSQADAGPGHSMHPMPSAHVISGP